MDVVETYDTSLCTYDTSLCFHVTLRVPFEFDRNPKSTRPTPSSPDLAATQPFDPIYGPFHHQGTQYKGRYGRLGFCISRRVPLFRQGDVRTFVFAVFFTSSLTRATSSGFSILFRFNSLIALADDKCAESALTRRCALSSRPCKTAKKSMTRHCFLRLMVA